jgi:hypothetical protein
VSSGGHGSSLDRLTAELAEPVALLGADVLSPERLTVLLARGEVRAWRVASVEASGRLSVECPLGAGPATVALAREPDRPVAAGAFVIARSMPVGPRRWVLLGQASVVGAARAPAFERLLRSLRAPRGEFWRVHGTVVAQAARAA